MINAPQKKKTPSWPSDANLRNSDSETLNHTVWESATLRMRCASLAPCARRIQLEAIANVTGHSDDNREAAQHDLALEYPSVLIREESHHE